MSARSESAVLEGNLRRAARPSLYELLQVSPAATPEVIQAAYRALARRYHPDVNPDPAAGQTMRRLNLARQVLADPLRRARYDAVLRRRSIRRAASTPAVLRHGVPPIRRVMLAPATRQSSATVASGPIARIVLFVVLFSLLAILVVVTVWVVDAALDGNSPYAVRSSSTAQLLLNHA